MIEIINTSGKILELSTGTVIPVERNNSLFNSPDKFIQDITYPGKAGLTENNKIFIENGHLVETSTTVYEMDVKVIVSGSPFFAGIFAYQIISGNISFNLKVNFAAVANQVKNTSIRDIYTTDQSAYFATAAAMEVWMKDTCVNPLKYPCVFFPVKNDSWISTGDITYKWLNYWDHENQKFKVVFGFGGAEPRTSTAMVPFFRGSYILKTILQALKFNVEGGYFSDPEEQNIYLFTRYRLFSGGVAPSLSYMPNLKIADFLKQYAERRRISLNFDVLNNKVTVETPQSVFNSKELIDIREYIESVDEITTSPSKGYEVTLKIDDTDDAWNTGTESESLFNPPYKLHVGSSETPVELEIGTLNKVIETDYSYPINQQEINVLGEGDPIDWPLSILKYEGMKSLPGAKVFPEAKPMDLNLDDALWYKFLNDSKPLVIYANIPPDLLAKMNPTIKLQCISNEGYYFVALPEQITYQLTNNNSELIRVKIKARPVISRYDTPAYVEVMQTEQILTNVLLKYKAYYDPKIHGITELRIERVPLAGSAAVFGHTKITSPTNSIGVGGAIGSTYTISGSRADIANSENRLYCGATPKYYLFNGLKGTFTAANGYYKFNGINVVSASDGRPIWIVF